MLTLDTRKKELLTRIVQAYIQKAEPISSAELASEFKLSPATIRNEMADLEKRGLIFQPHTSAGRIPSESAYRFYISGYLKEAVPAKNIKEDLDQSILEGDSRSALKQLAKKLAEISSEIVIVGFGRNDIYYTGISNLFSKPEFSSNDVLINVGHLVDHFDDVLYQLYDMQTDEISILIGKDNPFGDFFGTLMAKYRSGANEGVLALIGPMRMAYDINLGLINYSKKLVENITHD